MDTEIAELEKTVSSYCSIRPKIKLVLGLDFRMAALSSLTGVSPPASSALPCENPASSPSPLSDWMEHYDQGKKPAEKFIAPIDKYQGFEDMTNTMLNEFVEKILVHERDRKGSIETTQAVEVYFNFVGKYIPPAFRDVELTPEEQEALRKNEELKDRRHQAYLRRKARGNHFRRDGLYLNM